MKSDSWRVSCSIVWFFFLFAGKIFPESKGARFFNYWDYFLGGGLHLTEIPGSRPFERAFRDAWDSDRRFEPRLLLPDASFSQDISLLYQSRFLGIRGGHRISENWDISFHGQLTQYQGTTDLRQLGGDLQIGSQLLWRDLPEMERFRGASFVSDSLDLVRESYELGLGLRYHFWKSNTMSLYASSQFGAGSCIRGVACNVARGGVGLGFEFWGFSWNKGQGRLFSELGGFYQLQERETRNLEFREGQIALGVRYYPEP